MAHSFGSKKSNKDDSDSDFEDEVNNDPAFLVTENSRLNELLNNRDDCLERPTMRRGGIGLCFERLRRRWLS
jgi:hypothetical protein